MLGRIGLIAWMAATLGAHEIGTTRVNAVFHEGRYEIEVVTDGPSLEEKLAGAAPELALPKRIKAAFGGVEAEPAIRYSKGVIRLSGDIPETGGAFTWSYGWTFASYALTIRTDASPNATTQWLEGGQTSGPFAIAASGVISTRWSVVRRYLALGFTHIVPHGLDHMLFVLGIYLLSRRARPILVQVSAFTIAHSITLGLSLYGVVSVSPKIVEPLIAVSIAYVAIENLFLTELKSWRVALVFAFGLLHGLGFAGALKDLGLPRSEFLTALVSFNVGVESGQLAVIAAAFLLVGWHWSQRDWYRRRVVIPASALIACTALYWTVERLVL
ncbi:MAG TPA: HupE/UreJ family protein [Candidatus Solibacter sp.]|nr:HupE/UreJ family protein [Candidatus Solibacter sp.]